MKTHPTHRASLILAIGCSLATGCGLPERLGGPPQDEPPAQVDDHETIMRHAVEKFVLAERAGDKARAKRWQAVLDTLKAQRTKAIVDSEEEELRKAEERVK
jgi:hypothetical protein